MTSLLMLFRGELPLAVPLILAGVRTALVLNLGTATPASSGITDQRRPVPVPGSVLTVVMARIMDWPGTLVELPLRPRGLEAD